jgi:hypothetical protein
MNNEPAAMVTQEDLNKDRKNDLVYNSWILSVIHRYNIQRLINGRYIQFVAGCCSRHS